MKQNREQTLAWIDQDEGPELNISDGEPGGSSCHGVTMTLFREYRKALNLVPPTLDDMKAMNSELAGNIYSWAFLNPLRFDELPSGIDYRIADAAITLGETGACLITQMVLTQYPFTGVMDDNTIANLNKYDPLIIITALDAAWLTWKHGFGPTGWAKYNHGWINRVIKVHKRAIRLCAAHG